MHAAFVALATLVAAPPAASAQDTLGKIRFEVTGSKEAKAEFERGVLALHSFWYDEALEAFRASTKLQPDFVMGHWGEAVASARLFWLQDDIPTARAALARIASLDRVTPLEREWVAAAKALFGDGDLMARRIAYREALEKMHRDHPDDDEVTTFLALAIVSTIDGPEKEQLAGRARAASLAFSVYTKNPDHPGAAHYIIHALDTPELATLALPAAQRYAQIAPEAYHARHMPAHIFSRLGMWKEAYASCASAWAASEAWTAKHQLPSSKRDYHSLSWMMEIGFELGRRSDADRALATFGEAVRGGSADLSRPGYARQVRSYLERTGDWPRLEELLAPLASAPSKDAKSAVPGASCGAHSATQPANPAAVSGPPAEEMERRFTALARAEAAAEAKDVVRARRFLKDARAAEEKTRGWEIAAMGKTDYPKEEQLRDLERQAIVSRALRDDRGLAKILARMTAIEETMAPPEGTAGGRVSHELLGDALMRLDRARDALVEYRASLRDHPRRASSLLGAARAAVRANDAAAARELYGQLVATWKDADAGAPGLSEAQEYLASK